VHWLPAASILHAWRTMLFHQTLPHSCRHHPLPDVDFALHVSDRPKAKKQLYTPAGAADADAKLLPVTLGYSKTKDFAGNTYSSSRLCVPLVSVSCKPDQMYVMRPCDAHPPTHVEVLVPFAAHFRCYQNPFDQVLSPPKVSTTGHVVGWNVGGARLVGR
jgi:hypothetical protein